MTWAFVLEEAAHDSTRLIVRARVGPGARVFGLPWWAANYLVSVIHPYAAEAVNRHREARGAHHVALICVQDGG